MQHHRVALDADLAKLGRALSGDRDRDRIIGVGLTAVANRQHPHPGGQLGRHVHHLFLAGDQLLSQCPSDPMCALHRLRCHHVLAEIELRVQIHQEDALVFLVGAEPAEVGGKRRLPDAPFMFISATVAPLPLRGRGVVELNIGNADAIRVCPLEDVSELPYRSTLEVGDRFREVLPALSPISRDLAPGTKQISYFREPLGVDRHRAFEPPRERRTLLREM
jgi:hypothetical protein